jgi:hypothetical protein
MQMVIRTTAGIIVADDDTPNFGEWLPVIGRSIAYLCLADAIRHDPDHFGDTLAKVDFLEALGLSRGGHPCGQRAKRSEGSKEAQEARLTTPEFSTACGACGLQTHAIDLQYYGYYRDSPLNYMFLG